MKINIGLLRLKTLFLLVAPVLILNGCTPTLTKRFVRESDRPLEAGTFFHQLDQAVDKADVAHRAFARIDGFPYLRTNRYLVSLKDRLDAPEQKEAWLLAMQALDLEAREKEILNLPWPAVQQLSRDFNGQSQDLRQGLIRRMSDFSQVLLRHDRQATDLYPILVKTVKIPDDYSTSMRVFGLYPLVMPLVAYFTDNAYDKMRDRNKTPPDQQVVRGKIIAYAPPDAIAEKEAIVRKIYRETDRDPFGLPVFSETDKVKLAHSFAPVFQHDVVDSFDRIGTVEWISGKPEVDTEKPAVYYYFTAAMFKAKPIYQINYVTWTAGRLGPHAPSIERGQLDGITLRVSLDDTGKPVMVDGMNNCGCYHFFIPDKKRPVRIIPTSWEFDPVVIDYQPDQFPEKNLELRITSGWHQVEDVGTDLPSAQRETYQLIPYDNLEALPYDDQKYASLFDQEGVAVGSDRIEVYIFFSMGIPRVGAMRQRGHHPTQLIGREYFDEPYLLDDNFDIQ